MVVLVSDNGVKVEEETGSLDSSRNRFNLRLEYDEYRSLEVFLSVASSPPYLAF